ncbi:MAG: Glu-tRNA(Gln) amidotransferase subunit GatD [Candidatus Lokiarchaeota archaeon]|nr:Glu-tRNA(Gln) amidotransferase subunit GatD [Candidatus Lokiarchaeota archaeon]
MDHEDKLEGYTGTLRKKLENSNIKIWNRVRIISEGEEYEGILLPRGDYDSPDYYYLKLDNGYNVGIKFDPNQRIEVKGYQKGKYQLPEKKIETDKTKPTVSLLATGGTIASRLDYRTGAVLPAFTPSELYTAVPELEDICNLDTKIVFELLSEDMTVEHWQDLGEEIEHQINDNNVNGIVVAHGTDTMAFTGTAISFMLQDLTVPVVMVGSQRSSDRPSSDSAMNLIHAVNIAAKSDIAEVLLCMSGSSNHKFGYIHRPGLVRKMHSSRRDTFKSIGSIPLGKIEGDKITSFYKNYNKRKKGSKKVKLDNKFDPKVGLIYHYPGIKSDVIENFIDKKYHGIVIAGTGLGHISKNLLEPCKKAIDNNIAIVMAVQTLWGFTGLQVYERGREILDLGIIAGHNLLPETAYVKLSWVLGHTRDLDKVKKIMLKNIAGEIIDRELYKGFLVFQGVEPWIDDILTKI